MQCQILNPPFPVHGIKHWDKDHVGLISFSSRDGFLSPGICLHLPPIFKRYRVIGTCSLFHGWLFSDNLVRACLSRISR